MHNIFPLHSVADVSLKYKYGRLVLEVPLPSRNEKCLFFLRPMLMSVGDLITEVQREDPGVTASVFSKGRTLHELARHAPDQSHSLVWWNIFIYFFLTPGLTGLEGLKMKSSILAGCLRNFTNH